jgi:glutamate N-acetyltransferase/amino-acid N-acetyltransferase
METITDIKGVYASGIASGIKKQGKDLAYIFVPDAIACAGVFTRNAFRGACLEHTRSCLEHGTVKAVIINSGNSNVATGEAGRANVVRTATKAARLLGVTAEQVAIASTGIIGVQLPIERLEAGLETLLDNPRKQEGTIAAEAIMTTDLTSKQTVRSATIAGQEIHIAGMAKGSGMVAPNMGTMLAYFAINAAIPQKLLQTMLAEACDCSFNMVSVDTDTSTSDMALLFATPEKEIDLSVSENYRAAQKLITEACIDLAKMIARDGEGAEKLLEVCVENAASLSDARRIALNIVGSPLVKTAVHGGDPNWGRVIMAVGKDPGVEVDPGQVDLFFGSQQVFKNGEPFGDAPRERVAKELKAEHVFIRVDLHLGSHTARAWGCDLSKRYVEINVDYN